MKKLLLATAAVVVLSGVGFSQMMGGMMGQQGGMMGQPQTFMPMMGCMGCGMMRMMGMGGMMPGMMGMGGMGMMGMMQDPETMKLVQEHMMKCRKELMQKLAKRHNVMAERMLRMMTMHPDAFKEAIKKNPELKKKLKELLK
ncbi:hypothetical protein [Hydrogenivirga sp. 128-5-R1-1]|uniref:hypothetical protein n=1 Tax=Hydrogenivirga sp. 128-5-R1-1 TaxID=392423 RepID=UPI00015F0D03|nr:hypothetical protein [Hydrogenivirga sp. 128-5-R1-1]EDP75938.1 hypothetical protein HG1285_06415 [Hydrogenivirga sp. 128-5-R1-1]